MQGPIQPLSGPRRDRWSDLWTVPVPASGDGKRIGPYVSRTAPFAVALAGGDQPRTYTRVPIGSSLATMSAVCIGVRTQPWEAG